MATIVEEEYGNYLIKAGRLSGAFVARAFPKPSVKTQGLIAEATGKSEEAAIEALKEMIGERDAERSAKRRWEARAGIAVPQLEEFGEALRQANLSGSQVALLRALAVSEESGLTSAQMTRAAGYKSKDMAEKVFNKAGALIANYLGMDIADLDKSSGGGAGRLLAFQERMQDDATPPVWIMHKELRAAILSVL